MVINANGISINAVVEGKKLLYTVLEQTPQFKQTLEILGGIVTDEESGFSLKSNVRPSYNGRIKRFFVRGTEEKSNDKQVKCKFASADDANAALQAMIRLANMVVVEEEVLTEKKEVIYDPGGTSALRFNFINKDMATILQMTDHKNYPNAIQPWKPAKPVLTHNRHFNEHIGQGIDVLNKSVQPNAKLPKVVNQHRVTPQQAAAAVNSLKQSFRHAHDNNYLVAYWRLISSIRGIDAEDMDVKHLNRVLWFVSRKLKKSKKKLPKKTAELLKELM